MKIYLINILLVSSLIQCQTRKKNDSTEPAVSNNTNQKALEEQISNAPPTYESLAEDVKSEAKTFHEQNCQTASPEGSFDREACLAAQNLSDMNTTAVVDLLKDQDTRKEFLDATDAAGTTEETKKEDGVGSKQVETNTSNHLEIVGVSFVAFSTFVLGVGLGGIAVAKLHEKAHRDEVQKLITDHEQKVRAAYEAGAEEFKNLQNQRDQDLVKMFDDDIRALTGLRENVKIPIDKATRDKLEKARKKLSKVGIVPGKDLEKIEELYKYAMEKQVLKFNQTENVFKLLEYYQYFPSDFQMDLASNPSLISLNDYILLRKGQNLDLLKSRLGEKQVEGILKWIENKANEPLPESELEEKLVEERQRTLISEIFEAIKKEDPGEYYSRNKVLNQKRLYISVPEYSMLRFYALGDELPSDIKKPSKKEITKTVEKLKTRLDEKFNWFVKVTKEIELAEIQRQKNIQPFKEKILQKYPHIKPVPNIVLHPLENFELRQKPIKVMFKLADDQVPPYFNFVLFLGLVSTKLDQLK